MIRAITLCLIFITQLALAYPCKTLLTEPNDGSAPLIQAIKQAKQSVDVVMYTFTSRRFLNALAYDKNQGIHVQVLLEFKPYKAGGANAYAIKFLKKHHIALKSSSPKFSLTHQKTIIIDNKRAWILTGNFTYSSFHKQRNFAVLMTQKNLVNEILKVFHADWNRNAIDAGDYPLLWSPTTMRHGLYKLIENAHRSIKIYASSMSDFRIVGLLARKASDVPVELITSYGRISSGKLAYLRRHGVHIHTMNNVHAKIIITDNDKAYLGSANFTQPSLNKNRELGIIVNNPTIVNSLTAQFNHDYR